MKKWVFVFCFMLVFSLISGIAGAGEISQTKTSAIEDTLEQQKRNNFSEQTDFSKVDFKSGNPELPFLLQVNHKACMDQCSQAYDSCMSGSDSSSAKFRCADQRTMCTLGCNNEWYPKYQF